MEGSSLWPEGALLSAEGLEVPGWSWSWSWLTFWAWFWFHMQCLIHFIHFPRGSHCSRQKRKVSQTFLQNWENISSHEAPHLQGVPDWQKCMLSVCPSSLAGRAQVIVWTDWTLEAGPDHGALAPITGDIRVQDLGRGHMVGWGMRSTRRRRRTTKGEWRESMKRKIATVLLLLWKSFRKRHTEI